MKTLYKMLLARVLPAMLKLFSAVVKACAIIAIGCISVIVATRLCIVAWVYFAGYSDGALYSAGKECVVNTIGVDKINEEVKKVFAESGWKELSGSHYYSAPEDSCLRKLSRELSSSDTGTWERTMYWGYNALVLRFGCHYNYAWLVIVDPADHVFDKDNKISRIADNIGVCFDSGRIGH